MVDGPIGMLVLTPPVLQCPRLCLMELVYSLWRIPCISRGSGTPVLTVNALSIKLDGIAPFISPVLSESLRGERRQTAQLLYPLCMPERQSLCASHPQRRSLTHGELRAFHRATLGVDRTRLVKQVRQRRRFDPDIGVTADAFGASAVRPRYRCHG